MIPDLNLAIKAHLPSFAVPGVCSPIKRFKKTTAGARLDDVEYLHWAFALGPRCEATLQSHGPPRFGGGK